MCIIIPVATQTAQELEHFEESFIRNGKNS